MKNSVTAVAALVLIVCLGAAPQVPDVVKDPLVLKPVQAELFGIQEMRRNPPDPEAVFQRDGDQNIEAIQQFNRFGRQMHHGLTMFFQVEIEPDWTPILYEKPVNLKAIDSRGTDLTDIEPDQQNQLTYINKNAQSYYNKATNIFTLSLGSPSREASTLLVDTSVTLRVSTKKEDRRFLVKKKAWTRLPIDDPDLKDASMIISTQRNDWVQLKIQPAEAAHYIEAVRLVSGDLKVFSNGGGGGQNERTYSFNATVGDEVMVEFTMLEGVRKLPVEIKLVDEPLP